jgi:RHH-type transcriptional regulator, proline utilization regulon repressor / proline dehydrogenase / delta 1-pyrroline-5-carboxylate dehydrogenase
MVGAVVGVQPFGGEGLSGTGPKAGGPLYLLRLLAERPEDAAARALQHSGGEAAALRGMAPADSPPGDGTPLRVLREWAAAQGRDRLVAACTGFMAHAPAGVMRALPGPTGESNVYRLLPRDTVLCLAEDEADRLVQLAAVLAVRGRALWPAAAAALAERLPAELREQVALAQDWSSSAVHFDVVLHHGDAAARLALCQRIAERAGPIVGVLALDAGRHDIALERLVMERALSVNTAAAGGNASLMTIG